MLVRPSPRSRARIAASVRVATLSLVKIDEVLLFTVFSESPSRAAMAELDRPSASSPGRRAHAGSAAGTGPRSSAVAPSRASTRRATAGPKMASPSATAVTARRISSLVAPLSR